MRKIEVNLNEQAKSWVLPNDTIYANIPESALKSQKKIDGTTSTIRAKTAR